MQSPGAGMKDSLKANLPLMTIEEGKSPDLADPSQPGTNMILKILKQLKIIVKTS
jgi:hypothetical protein